MAETASSLGDPKGAAVLYGLLLPYADRVATSYPEISIGSVSYYLGILATTLGRADDAEHHFQAALQRNDQIGARPWLAHTQHDYPECCLPANHRAIAKGPWSCSLTRRATTATLE